MKYQILNTSSDTFQIISEFRGLAVIISDKGSEVIRVHIYDTSNNDNTDLASFRFFSPLKKKIILHINKPINDVIKLTLEALHEDVVIEDIEEVDWIVQDKNVISPEMAREYKAQYMHNTDEAKDYEDVVQIPLDFNDTLRKVVRAHINYIKATQADTDESETDSRTMHDLHTWEALLSHPLSINISQKKIDSFCNVHGIDFPIFN